MAQSLDIIATGLWGVSYTGCTNWQLFLK